MHWIAYRPSRAQDTSSNLTGQNAFGIQMVSIQIPTVFKNCKKFERKQFVKIVKLIINLRRFYFVFPIRIINYRIYDRKKNI